MKRKSKIKKAIGYIIYTFFAGILPHYGLGHTWVIAKKMRAFCCSLIFEGTGKNIDIGRRVKLSTNVTIGDNSGIGDWSYLQGKIKIGNNVMVGPYVAMIATNHKYDRLDIPMNQQGTIEQPIKIKDDVWIGYGAKLMPGVTVEEGVIIGAGAVVTKDIPQYAIVGGVPSRVIGYRNKGN